MKELNKQQKPAWLKKRVKIKNISMNHLYQIEFILLFLKKTSKHVLKATYVLILFLE